VTRLLIASHTYTEKLNRQKLHFLAAKFALRVVVPPEWSDTLAVVKVDNQEKDLFELKPVKIFFNGHINGYIYALRLLSNCLKEFKPDIVYVEEEPTSFALAQFSWLKRKFNYKLGFFTWENIYRRPRHPLVQALNLKRADFAVAGNKEAKNVLRQKNFSRPIKVIPQLGVDLGVFFPDKTVRTDIRKKLELKDFFVIGFAGRLVYEKGVHLLLQAVAQLRQDFRVLILGKGPYKNELEKLAQKLGVNKKIKWVSGVPHRQVANYLNAMDCLVLPSITTNYWKEQYGQVLVQAMACEVPVVGSKSGAIPEVVNDAGLLFTEGDIHDLAAKLEFLMSHQKEVQKLKQQALLYVQKNHSTNVLAAKLASFLSEFK